MQCDRRSSLDAFFSEVPPEPVDVAILGGTCSEATMALDEIVHYWNIPLVSSLDLYLKIEMQKLQCAPCMTTISLPIIATHIKFCMHR